MSGWFDRKIKKTHPKFEFLLEPCYMAEKALLEEWIGNFKVKDGIDKTIKQFQETFHSTFWEVYLNKVFSESGCLILDDITSPDFGLIKGNEKIFVEAVVSNIALIEPAEIERTLDDIHGENDHYKILDESIIRLYSSMCNKLERYNNHYSTRSDIQGAKFVLAMGDYAQINYGQSFYYPLLALLYGAYYDPDDRKDNLKILCEDSFSNEYKFIETHKKKNGAELKLGLFNSKEYEHVSAIIYSCTTTLGKLSSLVENHIPIEKCIVIDRETPYAEHQILRYSNQQSDETLYDGLFVYHNPNATNKLQDDFLDEIGVTHIRYDEENDPAISIHYKNRSGILKRRQVCMKGTERELLENYDNFSFIPVARTCHIQSVSAPQAFLKTS